MHWLLYFQERHTVPIMKAGCTPGPAWMGVENLTPTRIQSPDHPACSKLLYWQCYPGPHYIYHFNKLIWRQAWLEVIVSFSSHKIKFLLRQAEDIVWAYTITPTHGRDIAKFLLCHKCRMFSASGSINISSFTYSSEMWCFIRQAFGLSLIFSSSYIPVHKQASASSPPRVKDKNEWSYTSTPPYTFLATLGQTYLSPSNNTHIFFCMRS